MGINFFKWLQSQDGKIKSQNVNIDQIFNTAGELEIRLLCWNICVNMIANAVGRCEFKRINGGEEIQDREYYLWNYEPNLNENSTMFIHKIIASLYSQNEALIVDGKRRNGTNDLLVADTWSQNEYLPEVQNEYSDVVIGDSEYSKVFKEKDVLHLTLNHCNIRPVVDGITSAYGELVYSAMEYLKWSQGQHWKVHVNQMAQGADGWLDNFTKMINEQIKPFLTGSGAILPEFDGYTYSDVRADRSYQSANGETATLKNLAEEIFNDTARAFMIPIVLVNGQVENTSDANKRFLTNVIDPICDQLQEEITRKRFGYDEWKKGNYMRVDSSSIIHFDLFDAAAGIEKLISSGAFTINDIRKAAGQSTINEQWADMPFMTKNITSLQNAITAEA